MLHIAIKNGKIPLCAISIVRFELDANTAVAMAQKMARVNWNRGQYSDVARSTIIDPSPLKQGQKVKVIWGKSKKEYVAVVGCYPLEQGVQSHKEQSELAPRKAKAKRKLVSVCFCL